MLIANNLSVAGRMGIHSSALAPAMDMRGSTVTTFMPRSTLAFATQCEAAAA